MLLKVPKRLVLVVLLAACLGCASVPPEAVELSEAVGKRIVDMQVSHEKFVSAYFALSRSRIEDFLQDKWVPQFMATFVQDANLVSELQSAAAGPNVTPDQTEALKRALTSLVGAGEVDQAVLTVTDTLGLKGEVGQIAFEFSEAALKQVDKKRGELLNPLAAREKEALAALGAAYTELSQMQSTITAQLASVRRVEVEQDNVLAKLGLLRDRDKAIASAVDLNDKVVNALDKSQEAGETLKQLESLLNP